MSCYRRYFSHLNCCTPLFLFSVEEKHSGSIVSCNLLLFSLLLILRNLFLSFVLNRMALYSFIHKRQLITSNTLFFLGSCLSNTVLQIFIKLLELLSEFSDNFPFKFPSNNSLNLSLEKLLQFQ